MKIFNISIFLLLISTLAFGQNVGIGISNPVSKLHVKSDNFGLTTFETSIAANAGPHVEFKITDDATGSATLSYISTDYAVAQSTLFRDDAFEIRADGSGRLNFYTGGAAGLSDLRATILNNGNFGIGIETPLTGFHVNNQFRYTPNGIAPTAGYILTTDANGDATWQPAASTATWSTLSGIPAGFADDVDNVDDADADATNEIQSLTFTTSGGQNDLSISGDNTVNLTTQHNVILDTDDSDNNPNITTYDNGYTGEAVKKYTRGSLNPTGVVIDHAIIRQGVIDITIRTSGNDIYNFSFYSNINDGIDWHLDYSAPVSSSFTVTDLPSDPQSGIIIDFDDAITPPSELDSVIVHLNGGQIQITGNVSSGTQSYYILTQTTELFTNPF